MSLSVDATHKISNPLLAEAETVLSITCSTVLERLRAIPGFPPYIGVVAEQECSGHTKPIDVLWDLFCLGYPLCFLLDQLPHGQSYLPIEIDVDVRSLTQHHRKLAVSVFCTNLRSLNHKETLSVMELLNRSSTVGLEKVWCP